MSPGATIASALGDSAAVLTAAGIGEARLEARLLLGHVLGVGTETVVAHPERPVSGAERARLGRLVRRRARREPLAYIVGRREFWSLPLTVSPDTLVPRPESETVVEAVLARQQERTCALRILDLGTGSGCLLLALLTELPLASGVGVDISPAALAVARDNAAALGLAPRAAFVCADWAASLSGRFDVVVANPPYIADDALPALAPEVAVFEPRLALGGGDDGLDPYRAIIPGLARLQTRGGAAFFEVGDGQAAAVAAMLFRHGLQDIEITNDLAGIPRCVRAVAGSSA